jgi:hypothetical protein
MCNFWNGALFKFLYILHTTPELHERRVKLSLCLSNQELCHEDIFWGMALLFLTSILDGNEGPKSNPATLPQTTKFWCALDGSRARTVGTVTGCGLDDRGVTVPVPENSKIVSSPCVHTGSGAPPASLPKRTTGSIPGDKSDGL